MSTTLTLAFGAAVTTTVFSLVDTVLVKPLPYPDADRLVTVYESSPSAKDRVSLVAPGRLEDWQRLSRAFVSLSGSYTENVTDTSAAEPERLVGSRVSPRFFQTFAMPPLAGRFFTDDEERSGGPGAAVISENFWTRRFARRPDALGHRLLIGGRAYDVVGIMPRTFISATTDVWLPAQTPEGLLRVRDARFVNGLARIRPGISLAAATEDLVAVQAGLAKEFPRTDAGWSVEIRPLKDARIGAARRGLVLLFGAVGLLWLIAVANIAGLMLVQVQRRARELALRVALGASRVRVVGTVIQEGLIIALVGAALGAALGGGLVAALPTILTRTPRINELVLDWRALTFVAMTSLVAACAFGLAPGAGRHGSAASPAAGRRHPQRHGRPSPPPASHRRRSGCTQRVAGRLCHVARPQLLRPHPR